MRAAGASDHGAVAALLRESGLFAETTPGMAGFVVSGDVRGLAGCAAAELHGEQALLRSVATRAGARAAGLGAALAEEALTRAAAGGASEAWLLTETAEAFFAKRGFVRVAREAAPAWLRAHPQWTTQCPAAAIVMRRAPATPDRLFVYGTLRSGSAVPAARTLHARARSLGAATTRGRRVELGAYPGLLDGGGEISGECFLLPADPAERESLLAALDEYEGIGPAGESGLPFRREVRVVRDGSGAAAPSWLYLWRGEAPR